MKISSTLILTSFALLSAQAALACQVYTYEYASKEADIIFTGTLQKVSSLPEAGDMKPADAVFRVTQKLKGTIPDTITIRDTGNNCYGMPQFDFASSPTNEFLVFAVKVDEIYETFHPLPNSSVTYDGAQAFMRSWGKSHSPAPQ
jgi:hypothetical protein